MKNHDISESFQSNSTADDQQAPVKLFRVIKVARRQRILKDIKRGSDHNQASRLAT